MAGGLDRAGQRTARSSHYCTPRSAGKSWSAAAKELRAKGKPPEFEEVKIETLKEKKCVQLLHLGPYNAEAADIQRMVTFAREKGLEQGGPHHEIYISGPRRVPPERLRTILRHPLRAANNK